MRKYIRQNQQAKGKAANRERLALEVQLPMNERIAGVSEGLESFAAELGLVVIQRVMEAEIQQKLGKWAAQPICRHGHEPGYVIFGGRKVPLERPRLRSREDKEVPLTIGIDLQGKKHVLGLWHGAAENATVVKGLLEDLVSRGLDPERKLLIVIDGAKALRKAVKRVLGEAALVQRCRIHKLRNVLDHLPEEKKAQAAWRLRAACCQKEAKAAEKELRKTAEW